MPGNSNWHSNIRVGWNWRCTESFKREDVEIQISNSELDELLSPSSPLTCGSEQTRTGNQESLLWFRVNHLNWGKLSQVIPFFAFYWSRVTLRKNVREWEWSFAPSWGVWRLGRMPCCNKTFVCFESFQWDYIFWFSRLSHGNVLNGLLNGLHSKSLRLTTGYRTDVSINSSLGSKKNLVGLLVLSGVILLWSHSRDLKIQWRRKKNCDLPYWAKRSSPESLLFYFWQCHFERKEPLGLDMSI